MSTVPVTILHVKLSDFTSFDAEFIQDPLDVNALPGSSKRLDFVGTASSSRESLKQFFICGALWDDCTFIFKGSLTCEGQQEPLSVVCKISGGSKSAARHNEAKYYRGVLADVQGDFVPQFYGLYEHVSKDDDPSHMTCLILEDGGKPLKYYIRDEAFNTRVACLSLFMALHKRGIFNLEIVDGRNYLCATDGPAKNKVRYVGFSDAYIDKKHKCDKDMERGIPAWRFSDESVECEKLFQAVRAFGVGVSPALAVRAFTMSISGRYCTLRPTREQLLEDWSRSDLRPSLKGTEKDANLAIDDFMRRYPSWMWKYISGQEEERIMSCFPGQDVQTEEEIRQSESARRAPCSLERIDEVEELEEVS